jgi:peptide/nickel transport system permease protein
MRTYLLKRLLLLPITLLGITLLTFGVMKLAPGDPSASVRSQSSGGTSQAALTSADSLKEWRKERHLDRPWYVQYAFWLRDLCSFDLGKSFQPPRQPVLGLIADRLPVTIMINVITIVLMYLVAIPIGILGAAKQFSTVDRVLTILVFLLYSLPIIWVGSLVLAFLCPPFKTSGYQPQGMQELGGLLAWSGVWFMHLFLPVVCLTYASFAFLSRIMRSSLLEQIRQDFVRTARAKGLPDRVVLLRHATRNALIPIITLFGSILPELFGGSVIVEQLFSIPGIGQLLWESISERNYPVIMGIETVAALLTLGGMLLSDLLYVAANPAISYD